ncbi:MAG TPA: hypothetical protein VEI57_05335 [Nitrospirota bacterium]|nr:hypothetical protein [Nitrospirota bacterium]
MITVRAGTLGTIGWFPYRAVAQSFRLTDKLALDSGKPFHTPA